MRTLTRAAGIFLVLLCLCGVAAYGQTGNGAIQGTVKDASGAVVPAATVVAVHTATNRQYETVANGVGFFGFPSVQRGSYKITVTAPGMDTWQGDLLLQTADTVVLEPALKVGTTSTEVVVAGDVTPLVTTTNATLSNVLERTRLEQLPLNGRFFQGLVLTTTPGLEGAQAQPRVNGMRAVSMEFLQDGAVLTNRDTGDLAGRPPGMDSIEEFRVETNGSSARLNRPATTIIQTRSGTNLVHGAAFETARNNGFGVARQRQDFYAKAPHLVRNEFGATIGGPVFLPKVYNGKNKTFFFFSYEAYRDLEASTTSIDMPTMAMRSGDFSGLIDGSGRATTLYDPWSTQSAANKWVRNPFPNNQIPANRESPAAKYLYSITPAPTMTDVNPLVSANYFGLGPNNRLDWTITSRVDHRVSDKDQLFLRFSRGNRWSGYRSGNGSPVALNQAANITFNPIEDASGVASWTHTFSPTFFSETLFNVSNEDWNIFSGTNENWADQLGLPNPFKATGWPQLTGMGFGMDWEYSDNKRENITRIFNIDQNFTKIHGRHEFQFGGRFRNERLDVLAEQQQPQGSHIPQGGGTGLYDPSSGSSYSAAPLTGSNAANLFIGTWGYYSNQFVRQWYYLNAREYSLYFQDNFKVNNRLTLNLGLRWEFYPNISENNNVLTGFDLAKHAIVNGASVDTMVKAGDTLPSIVNVYSSIGVKWETPQDAGLPNQLINNNPHDFGPRSSFAYRLGSGKHEFVLRGGYGLYGFPIPLRTFDARSRSNPPTSARFVNDSGDAAQSPDGLPNYALRSVPSIIAGVNSTNIIDINNPSGITRGSFRTSFFDPNQPTSRAHEWNLGLEREIMPSTVAKVRYVGTHGSRLDQFYEYNEQPPAYIWYARTGLPTPSGTFSGTAQRPYDQTVYGTVEEYSKVGWSNFHSLQLELQRQYSKGYAYQLFYVMSNAMLAGGNGWSSDLVNQPNYYLPGAVPTDMNQLIRFLYYRRDSSIPKHRVRWNWIVDLPLGKGKKLFGNAGGFMNRVIGGWQMAGFGNVASSYTTLSTSFFGPTSKVQIYGKKYPIQDCRSGQCIGGYLWFNGYIPANRINSVDPKTGKPNGVMGVPADYKPAFNYMWNMPANPQTTDPMYAYYDTNTIWLPMQNGSVQRTTFNNGLNPLQNQVVPGPYNWGLDASLFKSMPIHERLNLRFNADFFNVLNMPGINGPSGSSGIISLQNSYNSPRRLQLTLRLQW